MNTPADPPTAAFVTDPFSGDGRIIAPGRSARPSDADASPRDDGCPFCAGAEYRTPPETDRIGTADGEWSARSFANRYPLSDHHEVIVCSARHVTSLHALNAGELDAALRLALRRRTAMGELIDDAHVYRHLYVNDGLAAGASLEHVHAQLIALPRSAGSDALIHHVLDPDDCAACALVRAPSRTTIAEHDDVLLLAHPAPRMSGHLLIVPRSHRHDPAGEASAISNLVHRALGALPIAANNLWLAADERDRAHWYVELLPRTSGIAGVELGLNVGVSMQSPEQTAIEARERLR